jgi:hypothetical protein
MFMLQNNRSILLIFFDIILSSVMFSCGNDKPKENFYTEVDPAVFITNPEGRFIVKEALENQLKQTHKVYTPFTELVFDNNRLEVEMVDEDIRRGVFKLNRLGNGHYQLDNLYELKYNPRNDCWQLSIIGESYLPLTLNAFTMPDTLKAGSISGFKYLVQADLIAGVYYVTDKNSKPRTERTVILTEDGQLIGVNGLSRYNILVNNHDDQLMSIELFDLTNKRSFIGCFERKDSVLSIYHYNEGNPVQKEKGDLYARLIQISGPKK